MLVCLVVLEFSLGVKSFVLNTVGFTCVTFTTGAMAWFAPSYINDVRELDLYHEFILNFVLGYFE